MNYVYYKVSSKKKKAFDTLIFRLTKNYLSYPLRIYAPRKQNDASDETETPPLTNMCETSDALEIFYLVGSEFSAHAAIQSAELKLTYRRTLQKNHFPVYTVEHSAHLAVSALGYDDFHAAYIVLEVFEPGFTALSLCAVEYYAAAEFTELRFRDFAFDLGYISFGDFV